MEEITKHPDGGSNGLEPATTGSAKETMATQPSAASPPEDASAARHQHWRLPAFAGALVGVLAGIALAVGICPIPAPAQTFVSLSAVGGVLIVGGLITLIVLIPAAGSNSDIKTEFLSARAAYFCVIAGLVLLGVVAVGAVSVRVMLTLGGR
jgi:hypothetical protein